MFLLVAMDFRSPDMPGGVMSLFGLPFPCLTRPSADGVLRCLVKYDEDRGEVFVKVGLRSALGESGGEVDAADLDGGVYGIPNAWRPL
jgi:hypothetical protein